MLSPLTHTIELARYAFGEETFFGPPVNIFILCAQRYPLSGGKVPHDEPTKRTIGNSSYCRDGLSSSMIQTGGATCGCQNHVLVLTGSPDEVPLEPVQLSLSVIRSFKVVAFNRSEYHDSGSDRQTP